MGFFRRALDSGRDYVDVVSGNKAKRVYGLEEAARRSYGDAMDAIDRHHDYRRTATQAANAAVDASTKKAQDAGNAYEAWRKGSTGKYKNSWLTSPYSDIPGDDDLAEIRRKAFSDYRDHINNVTNTDKAVKDALSNRKKVSKSLSEETTRLYNQSNTARNAAIDAASATSDALQQQTKYRKNTAIGAAGLTAAGVGGKALYNRGQEKTAMYLDILSTHPLWRN